MFIQCICAVFAHIWINCKKNPAKHDKCSMDSFSKPSYPRPLSPLALDHSLIYFMKLSSTTSVLGKMCFKQVHFRLVRVRLACGGNVSPDVNTDSAREGWDVPGGRTATGGRTWQKARTERKR